MTNLIASVSENNNSSTTQISGTLATGSRSGMNVVGLHFAGQQTGNVGIEFEGIFGTLTLNANGSYTYTLNNDDNDTDLLASGEQAFDRFVVTYRLGGVTHTLPIEFAINGTNEIGQTVSELSAPVEIFEDTVISRESLIRFDASSGYIQGLDFSSEPRWDFTNFGSIRFQSDGSQNQGYAVGPVPPPFGRVYNYGRITATSTTAEAGDLYGLLAFSENYGVVSATYNASYDPQFFVGRAIGGQGIQFNAGLIEAISNFDAYGVWAFGGGAFTNEGVIYVEGGSDYTTQSTDPLGIIGLRSGGPGSVVNEGTIHVVSNAANVPSVGAWFRPGSTNIYDPTTFENSGTIVADRAIVFNGNFDGSMYLLNSGHIEGTIELSYGINQITNTATGSWIGDFILGVDADLLRNAGDITGSIFFGTGGDFYVGMNDGHVSGTVFGQGGNDVLEGSSASERMDGGTGNDWLAGRGGSDTLTGGSGSDTFVYFNIGESSASARDVITDFQGGFDRIDISAVGAASFSLTASGADTILRANAANGTLEVLIRGNVTASDIINETLQPTLSGTSASDTLAGLVQGSTLFGLAGNDTLRGTAGNDLLDGGSGADTLFGGYGNDTYVIDSSEDTVTETANGGMDEIRTFISTILPSHVENGTALGSDHIAVSGNEFDNILTGNSGDNTFRGNGGNDTLIGGLGADLFLLFFGSNTVQYGSVNESTRANPDQIYSAVIGADRIDLTGLDVQYFTIEGTRRTAVPGGGASLQFVTLSTIAITTSEGDLVIEIEGLPGLDLFEWQREAGIGANLFGLAQNDYLEGTSNQDTISGGLGDDTLNGGSNIDTAVVSGNAADYALTQTSTGVWEVVGADGTDTLTAVEYLQFDDELMRLLPGTGISVNFDTADTSLYQTAMQGIRDFDGNVLGGDGSWLRIGSADVNGDGDVDQILVNQSIGRFATVGTADDGLVYFDDHSWAGETRVAGIYIDPLVASGEVMAGSGNDSQTRFQNDLAIENINRVLGAQDYNNDGIQEVYFALTDGTAYLRALMHEDGNIRYANYQSEQEVIDYLTANGYDDSTYGDWFSSSAGQETQGGDKELAALLGLGGDGGTLEGLSIASLAGDIDIRGEPADTHEAAILDPIEAIMEQSMLLIPTIQPFEEFYG